LIKSETAPISTK